MSDKISCSTMIGNERMANDVARPIDIQPLCADIYVVNAALGVEYCVCEKIECGEITTQHEINAKLLCCHK